MTTRATLKGYFETGDIPTQSNFEEVIDSNFNITDDTLDNIPNGTTYKLVTAAEKTVLSNTSGTNTGDQDLSGKEDVGVAASLVSIHESTYYGHDELLITPQTISYSLTPTQDYTSGKEAIITLTGDVTTYTLSNVPNGGSGEVVIIQNATGGYGVAAIAHAGLTVKYLGGGLPTSGNINSAANGHTILYYERKGSYLYISFAPYI